MENSGKQDIFDKILHWAFRFKPLRSLEDSYAKVKEIVLYIFFGALTTFINMAVFWLFTSPVPVNVLAANIVAWVAAVIFAFFTNKSWVFGDRQTGAAEYLRQAGTFFSGRLMTLIFEEAVLLIFVSWLGFGEMLIKIIATIGVLILNYIISKLFVFNKKSSR